MEYVYHVVTERPMSAGQIITLGGAYHNGVYQRVMTFQRIANGEKVEGGLADVIKSDMETWAKVAYRELALEKVRVMSFPQYPSRMACLYTVRTLEEAKNWAAFFQEIGREVYAIAKLKVFGNIFDGDALNCFDGTENEADNLEKAEHYWRMEPKNERPIAETLIDGDIYVEELTVSYQSVE